MKIYFLPLLVSFCVWAKSQPKETQTFYSEAKKAYSAKDFPMFYEAIYKAHELHPYHQGILYQCALASALTNKPEEAVTLLKKAILIDADFDVTHPDLSSLQSRKDFQDLLKLKTELNASIVHSQVAFTLKDRQLHTEGIAYNKSNGDFYVGSIHKRKIVKIDKTGNASDFTFSEQYGMTSVFGLKVDTKQNVIWTCTSPMAEMQNYDSTLSSFVYAYDLKDGKLKAKYSTPASIKGSVFGDLVFDNHEDVFISDSRNNIIFRVNKLNQELEKYFVSAEFWNIQGITFSDDSKYLFIADYIKGIFRLDMNTKQLVPLRSKLEVSLKGIDGLTLYKNSLIAIQNGVNPQRVTRYYLNADFTEVMRFEIIDRKHPDFNEPTIGTLVGNEFFYIANSQWGGYLNGKIKPSDQLQDIVILKSTLD